MPDATPYGAPGTGAELRPPTTGEQQQDAWDGRPVDEADQPLVQAAGDHAATQGDAAGEERSPARCGRAGAQGTGTTIPSRTDTTETIYRYK